MLKNNILVKITGSIAAYKVGYLISKLVQNGFEVKTVVTESALNFIGKATLEGLTNNHAYCDTFESNKMMSHISLTKWADLTILVPADANTINKFSAGIADNLVTSLFLAHDTEKPYLIAPAMNVAMYNHPATQSSLEKLKEWGCIVLPTEEGYLACGDEGKGKLLEPDKIYGYIISNLNQSKNKKRILITYGGTKEKIDNIRYLTNLSTGTTGAEIARYFYLKGYDVTLIKTKEAEMPEFDVKTFEYGDYSSLQQKLKKELNENDYQAVIHLAAISDYSPDNITVGNKTFVLPSNDKISSENDSITITFKRNTKIIDHIKSWSLNKTVKLIGFKFVNSSDRDENDKIINKLFFSSKADYIVFNTFESRINDKQTYYEVIDESSNSIKASNARELAKVLEQLIKEE
jgi:phosphopantothenoylcysteine decarboxylase/phosphopantothenate--cysteine ligase